MKIIFKHEIKSDEEISFQQIINLLLKYRKIKNINEFLSPPSPLKINISDFGFKREIKRTLKILTDVYEEKKMIIVYTDYDADGITGGAILWETLNLLGFKVMPYVPHRKLEGYGFSKKGIDSVKEKYDPALIISVDHGITARDKIKYAKSLGIEVIVTDHHLKPEKLPDTALAVFHIPELSGSGVSYFFSKMIFEHFFKLYGHDVRAERALPLQNNFSSDYLALAAIGSIADLVPLTGATRSLVYHGLAACSNTKRIGLKHILKQAGIEGKKITPYEVGFIVAPRINAVGRLEHAIDALRLLCTPKEETAFQLASRVGETNRQRQDLVKTAVEKAIKTVETGLKPVSTKNKIIVLVSETWHEGIIGLIASKIAEKYYRPTIVMTKSDGFLKASARSIPSFHMTDFLRSLKKYLVDVGGHAQAAGFTIEKNKLDEFIEAAEKKADKLISEKDLEKVIETDLKIPLSKINIKLAQSLEKLQPFGIGNPQPLFYSEAGVIDARLFGKTNDHLKIFVKDPTNKSFPLELIAFGMADKYKDLSTNKIINIVYKLEVDRWGGNERLRGIIISILF